MPFKSEAQRRWMHANEPEMADRWEAHTPKGKKLPERVKKKKSSTESLIADIAAIITEEPDVFVEYDMTGTGVGNISTQLSTSTQNAKDGQLQATDINREVKDIQQRQDGDKELDKRKQEEDKLRQQEKLQRQKLLEPQYDAMTKSLDDLRGAVTKSTGQFDTGIDTVRTMDTNLDGLGRALEQFNKAALQ